MNWTDTNYKIKKIKPFDINPIFENNNSFKIVFAGTMGIYQGIDTIIDSAKKLRLKDINFYFILENFDLCTCVNKRKPLYICTFFIHFAGNPKS